MEGCGELGVVESASGIPGVGEGLALAHVFLRPQTWLQSLENEAWGRQVYEMVVICTSRCTCDLWDVRLENPCESAGTTGPTGPTAKPSTQAVCDLSAEIRLQPYRGESAAAWTLPHGLWSSAPPAGTRLPPHRLRAPQAGHGWASEALTGPKTSSAWTLGRVRALVLSRPEGCRLPGPNEASVSLLFAEQGQRSAR